MAGTHIGHMQAIFIIGHILAFEQSHSGGFGNNGQRGQKQFGGKNGSGRAGDTAVSSTGATAASFCTVVASGFIRVTPHGGQWHLGFGHANAGQRQTIPSLPLVLALGVIGQPHLHWRIGVGMIGVGSIGVGSIGVDSIGVGFIGVGKTIASETPMRAAKTITSFMVMVICLFY